METANLILCMSLGEVGKQQPRYKAEMHAHFQETLLYFLKLPLQTTECRNMILLILRVEGFGGLRSNK